MRAILAICREHGQGPAWWDDLSRGHRTLLLAERNLRLRDEHEAVKAAKRARGR